MTDQAETRAAQAVQAARAAHADHADHADHVRVAIVGTGFSGLGAAVRLEQEGIEYTVLERAQDVGGTWRDNQYPGCRCDVPSHLYSFSFAPNPEWSETYSPQPEIWDYLRRTAKDFGIVERIRFGHEVRRARWDDAAQRWHLDTAGGPLTADVVLLGNGPLAEPAIPDIEGLDTFEGTTFHSAAWRHDHDLAGERVAVIGTGASAIQFVPEIQPAVAHLTVFQRTPPWVLPHTNRRITDVERRVYRRFPVAQRLVRAMVYWSRELFVTGLLRNSRIVERVERLASKHLAQQVKDPELRAKLTPDYRPGCKRLLLSNDWYPAIQQPNVRIETSRIVRVTPTGVVTADGAEHEVDTIIFGTGFRVTDNPIADRIVNAAGETLSHHWHTSGMKAYLGTSIDTFPNFFMLAGPNTGIGHTSLVVMIEAQLQYVVDAIRYMERRGVGSVDVRPTVARRYGEEIQRKAARTVWNSGGCASWYLDSQGRNTTIWPDYTYRFIRRTRRFDASKYEVVARRTQTRELAGVA